MHSSGGINIAFPKKYNVGSRVGPAMIIAGCLPILVFNNAW